MADEPGALVTSCPWCSEPLPALGAADCPSCGAHLVADEDVEIPGVTAVDRGLLAAAAAPRKVRRTFGALLVGDDDEIPPPSEAEMPALAPPDLDVRREMLRLELEARLTGLRAEARALAGEDDIDELDAAPGSGPPPSIADVSPEPSPAEPAPVPAEPAPVPADEAASPPPA